MTNRRTFLTGGAALALGACTGTWAVDYEAGIDPEVSRGWRLKDVLVVVPEELTVSNNNSFAPNADIVWHGDPFGDRKAQVAQLFVEGLTQGASELKGNRPVTLTVRVLQFHAVTPAAVARAPAAVHRIRYLTQVLDAESGAPLTAQQEISADLEAHVGAAAIAAAIEGRSQRVRIVQHLARVTRGWLGFGPDQRRTFSGIGR